MTTRKAIISLALATLALLCWILFNESHAPIEPVVAGQESVTSAVGTPSPPTGEQLPALDGSSSRELATPLRSSVTGQDATIAILVMLDGAPAVGAKLFEFNAAPRVSSGRASVAAADDKGVMVVRQQALNSTPHVIRHGSAIPFRIEPRAPRDGENGENGFRVDLVRGHVLTVRANDLAGNPVAGVTIHSGSRLQGRPELVDKADGAMPGDDPTTAIDVVQTGEDGSAILENLSTGTLVLRYSHESAMVSNPRVALSARIPEDSEKLVVMSTIYGVAVRTRNDVLVYATGLLPASGGVHPVETSRALGRAKRDLTARYPEATVLVTNPPADPRTGRVPEEVPVQLEILGRLSGWSKVEARMRPLSHVMETIIDLNPGSAPVTARVTFRFENPDGSDVDYRQAMYRSPPGSTFVQGDRIVPGTTAELGAGEYIVIIPDRPLRAVAKGYDHRGGGLRFRLVAGEEREIGITLTRPVRPLTLTVTGPGGPLPRLFVKLTHASAAEREVDNRHDDVNADRTFWLPADEDVVVEVFCPGYRRASQRAPAGAGMCTLEFKLEHDA